MSRHPKFHPVKTGELWCVSVPAAMSSSGQRVRRYFKAETAAKRFAVSVRSDYAAGTRGGMISADLAREALTAQRILDGTGITIVQAAKLAADKSLNASAREPFGLRYHRVLASREMEWRPVYLASMERMPNWLPLSFMQTPCGQIDREMMESALLSQGDLSRSTLDMRMARISAILGHRERHKKSSEITILTGDEVAAMIDACNDDDERMVVSVLLYAGIRPDAEHGEISRLDWSDFGARSITVSSDISKTGTDRLIPINPALRRGIAGHPKSGPVLPTNWKRRWSRIRKTAGITANDVTRHTFASHYLAWRGEAATKNVLGHTAGSMTLFRHYRRAVSESAGKAYFA